MSDQTARLFGALGAPEAIGLVLALLERESATVGQLAAATGCTQPTASRYLKELGALGVLTREGSQGPYLVACPDEVRRLLEAATSASLAGLERRTEAEKRLNRRIRRTRLADSRKIGGDGA